MSCDVRARLKLQLDDLTIGPIKKPERIEDRDACPGPHQRASNRRLVHLERDALLNTGRLKCLLDQMP